MNKQEKALLQALLDREWHIKPPKGINTTTVNVCFDHGWVRLGRFGLTRIQTKNGLLERYRIAIKITRQGVSALKKN